MTALRDEEQRSVWTSGQRDGASRALCVRMKSMIRNIGKFVSGDLAQSADAVVLKALAIVAAKAYANVRPGGVKVHAGAPILELGLTEANFAEMARAGMTLVGEIGLGSVKTGKDAAPMVEWARRHGMTVTIHTGGPSIAGSSAITAEVVLEAHPH